MISPECFFPLKLKKKKTNQDRKNNVDDISLHSGKAQIHKIERKKWMKGTLLVVQ